MYVLCAILFSQNAKNIHIYPSMGSSQNLQTFSLRVFMLFKAQIIKTLKRRGLITVFPYSNDLVPTLNCENQPMVSGILTQPSNRKKIASRRKRSMEKM